MAKFAGTFVLFFGFTAGCCDLRFGTGCCGYFRKGPASHPSAFLSPTSVETCGYIIARESMLIATRLPLPFMRLYTCDISFCISLKLEKMWWTVAKLLTDRVVVKRAFDRVLCSAVVVHHTWLDHWWPSASQLLAPTLPKTLLKTLDHALLSGMDRQTT